jgi:formylglycine-generating enzyme required for sulfatase activity
MMPVKVSWLGRAVCAAVVCAGLVSAASAQVNIETVPVGNPGNPDDTHWGRYGGVDYEYNIGKYEVTAGQYCEFLNAVASTEDTHWLYSFDMVDDDGCQIQRTGSQGNYTYNVAYEWADRPVNYVSWADAARFANWLHNGQPTGAQDDSTTEDGAYELKANLTAVSRKESWEWAIATEDEWYKAAYHKNDGDTGHYFNYTTSSDIRPGYVTDAGKLSEEFPLVPFVEGGIDPGNYATYDGDGGMNGIGSPYYRTEVGEWENSDSPYGTYDQGGNVWEWTETEWEHDDGERIYRGGYSGGDHDNLDASDYWSRRHYLPGNICECYSRGFRVVTALATIDEVMAGQDQNAVTSGGSDYIGGIDFQFSDVTVAGAVIGEFATVPVDELPSGFDDPSVFISGSDPAQMWSIEFSGEFEGPVELTLCYDDTNLVVDEELLIIQHYISGVGLEALPVLDRDLVNNTITITTDSFSNFALAEVPEPATVALFAVGGLSMLGRRWRR